MKKLVIIDDCEDCPHCWFYLGVDECCILLDKKRIPLEVLIPDWCPLKDAPKDWVETK